jgi:hypothetical protein
MQQRVEQLVDMALSVSALEIFVDRQPVDFGMTAVVELWLGPHQGLGPGQSARDRPSGSSGANRIMAWVGDGWGAAGGEWLVGKVSKDRTAPPEWRLVVLTESSGKVHANGHGVDDDAIVVITPDIPDSSTPTQEQISSLFAEVDKLVEAQSLAAALGSSPSAAEGLKLEQAACALGAALRANLARAIEQGSEDMLKAALQRAQDAEVPEAPPAKRKLMELQLDRLAKEGDIAALEMAVREAMQEGAADLPQYVTAKATLNWEVIRMHEKVATSFCLKFLSTI